MLGIALAGCVTESGAERPVSGLLLNFVLFIKISKCCQETLECRKSKSHVDEKKHDPSKTGNNRQQSYRLGIC